jgi:hypothetical protein
MKRFLREVGLLVLVLAMPVASHAEIFVSGQMATVARNLAPDITNKTFPGFSPYDAVTMRLFFDATISERLAGFVQLYTSTAKMNIFPYGAYLRYDHTPQLHLEAGLIPTPVGLWGARTYADKNPLIAVPAIYQYRSSLDAKRSLQTTVDQLLKKRGEAGNAPILYDFCWNTGVHGYANVGSFGFGLALLNGAMSNPQRSIVYERPNVVAHVEWIPSPYATVGAWAAAGPYLAPEFQDALEGGGGYRSPAVAEVNDIQDYNQIIIGTLLHLSGGHWDLHAEGLVNRFEHPYFGDLDNTGGYVDIRHSFATRWFIAGRADHLSYSRLDNPAADGARWDYPLTRWEAGLGRKMTEHSRFKIAVQVVRYDGAPAALDDEVVALQFSVEM